MNAHDNKKGQDLDKYEIKSDKYIFFPLFS